MFRKIQTFHLVGLVNVMSTPVGPHVQYYPVIKLNSFEKKELNCLGVRQRNNSLSVSDQ